MVTRYTNNNMFIKKYYYLFLLVPLFTQCFSYIHIVERALASFDDSVKYTGKIKSCTNCKYFIENEKTDFSRCSKFNKQKLRQKNKYNFQYIKADLESGNYDILNNCYLATTCRNNETMCGMNAKYYERKYNDVY
jgi:hypothetical protein